MANGFNSGARSNAFNSGSSNTSTTNSSGSAGGGAAGIFASSLTTIIGTIGAIKDIENRKDALIRTMEGRAESVKFSQFNKKQQLEDIDRLIGDKLTASGLEALKAESRLKATAAETGASGTTIQDAVATADVNRLHRDAAILREGDVAKANKLTELISERLSFGAELEGLVSGQPSNTSALVAGLSGSLQGLKTGLSLMTTTQKEEFFGVNITGESNG